jgi:hypothetical protein
MPLGIGRGGAQALKLAVEQPQLILGAVPGRKLLDGLACGLEQPMELCLLGVRNAASRHAFVRCDGEKENLPAAAPLEPTCHLALGAPPSESPLQRALVALRK